MILEERPGVGVILRSKEQYDQYMQMCEDAGWWWYSGDLPTEYRPSWLGSKSLIINIEDRFSFTRYEYHSKCTSYVEFEDLCPINFDEVYNSYKENSHEKDEE